MTAVAFMSFKVLLMKKYKLIVSDIDMTLIDNGFNITKFNVNMIRRAMADGAQFMLCTGRIFGSARPYARYLGTEMPIITSNGAAVLDYDSGSLIFGRHIEQELAEWIFHRLDEIGLTYHFYSRSIYYTKDTEQGRKKRERLDAGLARAELFLTRGVEDPASIPEYDPVYKITVRCWNDEETALFMETFREVDGISITSSAPLNYEISAEGVCKGAALRKFAEMNGIPREDIMAFGDNYNDVEMLQFAGTGVAVKNAVGSLKKVADYITDTNVNSGVGKAIARFMYGEE